DQHLGRRITQFFDDLLTGGFFLQRQESAQWVLVAHVLGKTVENTTHFHDSAGALDFIAKNFSAVRRRKNGLADIESHFAAIDIKGGNHFDILRLVRADATVHEAGTTAVAIGSAIKIDSLDERTGTVAHSDDGDSDFAHFYIVKAENYLNYMIRSKIQVRLLQSRWLCLPAAAPN